VQQEDVMKTVWILMGMAGLTLGSLNVLAADASNGQAGMRQGQMMMQGGMQPMPDERESAGIPEPMKARHLERMRSHLEAVHDIVDAMARGAFGQASKTARQELAMRPGMGKGMDGKGMGMGKGMGDGMMCSKGGMTSEDFKSIGMAFHESAGKLADVLEKGDVKESLNALGNTMNYCIQCHATFRQ